MESISSPEYRKLTDEEIAKYLWNSFKFSQGLPNVQKMILRYCSYFMGPQKITKERKENILEIFSKMTGSKSKTVFSPVKLQEKGFHWTTRSGLITIPTFWFQLNSYLSRLNKKTYPLHEKILKKALLTSLMWLDYKYLVILERRPRRHNAEKVEDDLLKDEHFSFIVHYLIRQNPTGIPELDILFKRLNKYFFKEASFLVKKPYDFFFNRIIKAYNATHSNKVTDMELKPFISPK